jgi:hypothetical protein
MKRTASIFSLVIASIALASQASALALFFGPPSATSLAEGETVTIQYFLDTQGETQVTSVFASVIVDPNVLQFVSGDAPGAILFNASTYASLGQVGPPQDGVPGDAPGRVRAASYATSNPLGSDRSNPSQLLVTLTFMAVGPGTVQIQALLELDINPDEITVATVSVTELVALSDSELITVPEPSSAAMALAALGTIGFITRRSHSAAP